MKTYTDSQGVKYSFCESKNYWILGFNDSVTTNAIEDRLSIKDLVIPERIEGKIIGEIASYAFYLCTNLKFVTINSRIKQINYCSFYQCWNLTSINIPSTCEFIADCAISCVMRMTTTGLDSDKTAPGTLAVKFEPNSTVKFIGTYGIERKEVIIITYCGYESPIVASRGLFYEVNHAVVYSPVQIDWGNTTSIVDPSICLLIEKAKEVKCKTIKLSMNYAILHQMIYIFIISE